MNEGNEDDKALREALVALQEEIKARVELERERDPLTMLGKCDDLNDSQLEQLEHLIEQAKIKIAEIRVTAHEGLQCTVSVGWTTSESIGDEVLDFRGFLRRLEDAVAAAKMKGRDCVVRYEPSLSKFPTFTLRTQCNRCNAKYALDVDHEINLSEQQVYCPNCGERSARPPAPVRSLPQTTAIQLSPIRGPLVEPQG